MFRTYYATKLQVFMFVVFDQMINEVRKFCTVPESTRFAVDFNVEFCFLSTMKIVRQNFLIVNIQYAFDFTSSEF